MKTLLKILFCLVAFVSPLMAATDNKPGPEETVVKTLDEPLPTDEGERGAFLWKQFANKPEETKFESYETANWKQNYAVFADVLVKKAEAQGLDGASLRKVLDEVLKDSRGKVAYLPVGAYQTMLYGNPVLKRNPVWIVVVKWETPDFAPHLGHIRVFAFDQKTLKRVGYTTCS